MNRYSVPGLRGLLSAFLLSSGWASVTQPNQALSSRGKEGIEGGLVLLPHRNYSNRKSMQVGRGGRGAFELFSTPIFSSIFIGSSQALAHE